MKHDYPCILDIYECPCCFYCWQKSTMCDEDEVKTNEISQKCEYCSGRTFLEEERLFSLEFRMNRILEIMDDTKPNKFPTILKLFRKEMLMLLAKKKDEDED